MTEIKIDQYIKYGGIEIPIDGSAIIFGSQDILMQQPRHKKIGSERIMDARLGYLTGPLGRLDQIQEAIKEGAYRRPRLTKMLGIH